MTRLALAFALLLLPALPVAAQTTAVPQSAIPALDSPAAYRQQNLLGPEHARLLQPLLDYEVANIRSLLPNKVQLTTSAFTFTITNRATVAEVTGGTYLMTYYNALNKAIASSKGRFGGLAPGASRNQSVTFRRPADTDHTELTITAVQAE